MNNLVKQQGCAGSGVTDFTPTVKLLSERRAKKPPESVCHSWKGNLRLLTCISHSTPLALLPLSHGIPILLLHLHPQPTIQYFPCGGSLPSQWMKRFLSRQSDTTAYQALCLFPEWNMWEKNETVLEKGVTRRTDHREKRESALYHSILCKATVLSSHQFRHPEDASTWFLREKGLQMYCPGTVISHACRGSLNIHIKKTPHQSGSFPPDQMTEVFCFGTFFFFWPETSRDNYLYLHFLRSSWFQNEYCCFSSGNALFEELQTIADSLKRICNPSPLSKSSLRPPWLPKEFYCYGRNSGSGGAQQDSPLVSSEQTKQPTGIFNAIHSNIESYC